MTLFMISHNFSLHISLSHTSKRTSHNLTSSHHLLFQKSCVIDNGFCVFPHKHILKKTKNNNIDFQFLSDNNKNLTEDKITKYFNSC